MSGVAVGTSSSCSCSSPSWASLPRHGGAPRRWGVSTSGGWAAGFGMFIAGFFIGGDIYTAYMFIAVPATLYAGSAVGFFAVPYTSWSTR